MHVVLLPPGLHTHPSLRHKKRAPRFMYEKWDFIQMWEERSVVWIHRHSEIKLGIQTKQKPVYNNNKIKQKQCANSRKKDGCAYCETVRVNKRGEGGEAQNRRKERHYCVYGKCTIYRSSLQNNDRTRGEERKDGGLRQGRIGGVYPSTFIRRSRTEHVFGTQRMGEEGEIVSLVPYSSHLQCSLREWDW